MGVCEGVLTTIENTPASGIHQLVPENMLRMTLVTSLDFVDLFTAGTICGTDSLPANCREIPANKPAMPTVPTVEASTAGPNLPRSHRPNPNRAARTGYALCRGSRQHPLCNPDCPEWISAEGAITPQTPQKLRQLLATLGTGGCLW